MTPSSPAATAETTFDFSRADFDRVRELIYRHAGISLNPSKQSMVYSRLSRRLRALGSPGFGDYLDALEGGAAGKGEWQEFVNALTTNLTSFYREPHHFPLLAEHMLRQAADGAKGPLRLWCSAASTGEEPYTLAITMMEAFGSLTPPVSIIATDIDTAVLAKADLGIYAAETVEKLAPALLKRYFLRGRGAQQGLVRVRPEVRALLRFGVLNLLDARWPLEGRFDAVFCRNVMIYFDKPTQHRVLEKIAARLTPEGLLFAGHSENFTQARELFELQGKTVYRLAAQLRQAA
jgi:chemotaxis protein methyltransferase CheR